MIRLEGGPAHGREFQRIDTDAIEVTAVGDGGYIDLATYVRDRERPDVFRYVDLDAMAGDDG